MRITVLQWNVWFKEDIDRVVRVIKKLNPDVVCVQELTQGYNEQTQDNTWEHIKLELGYDAIHQTIPIITDSENWIQANAIFSRYPILSHKEHWLHAPTDYWVSSGSIKQLCIEIRDLLHKDKESFNVGIEFLRLKLQNNRTALTNYELYLRNDFSEFESNLGNILPAIVI